MTEMTQLLLHSFVNTIITYNFIFTSIPILTFLYAQNIELT